MALTEDDIARGDGYLATIIFTPEGVADPAPWYRKIREEMPVFRSGLGQVVLSRYEDCRTVLRDNRFGKGDRNPNGNSFMPGADDSEEMRQFRVEMAKRRNEGTRSRGSGTPVRSSRRTASRFPPKGSSPVSIW